MEEGPDMSKIKEPGAMVAVLIFAIVFMVGFGIWHAPLLDFASKAILISVPLFQHLLAFILVFFDRLSFFFPSSLHEEWNS